MRVLEIHPRVRTVAPRDYAWQWPASFIEINVVRLQELGRLTETEGGAGSAARDADPHHGPPMSETSRAASRPQGGQKVTRLQRTIVGIKPM